MGLEKARAGIRVCISDKSAKAVTLAVGAANDIPPMNKKEIGERLVLLALPGHYGRHISCSEPQFVSMEAIPEARNYIFGMLTEAW
jgi:hypothetical protein